MSPAEQQQHPMPLDEWYRTMLGKEPPVLTAEDKARFAEQRRRVQEQARVIYGTDSSDQAA